MNVLDGDFSGAWLKAKRKELGLLQVDFARIIGISQAQLSLLENDKTSTLSYERVQRIRTALEQYERDHARITNPAA